MGEIAEIKKRKSQQSLDIMPALVSPESKDVFTKQRIDNMEDAMSKEMDIMKSGSSVGNKSHLFRHKSQYKWQDADVEQQNKEMQGHLAHLISLNSKSVP